MFHLQCLGLPSARDRTVLDERDPPAADLRVCDQGSGEFSLACAQAIALVGEGLKPLLEVTKRLSEVELQRTDRALVPIERTRGAKRRESARLGARSASAKAIFGIPMHCSGALSGPVSEIRMLHGGDLFGQTPSGRRSSRRPLSVAGGA